MDLENADLVPAAVLIPLIPAADGSAVLSLKDSSIRLPTSTLVVLTVRTHTVEHHKGQISFPGGVFEAGDETLLETALRETFEEIGLPREQVQVVAELPDIPTVATKFRVKPFVGVVQGVADFRPNPHEIGEILMVPLAHLLEPAHSVLESYERGGIRFQIKAYHYQGHRIWGATALILQTFIERYLVKA